MDDESVTVTVSRMTTGKFAVVVDYKDPLSKHNILKDFVVCQSLAEACNVLVDAFDPITHPLRDVD